MTLIEILVTIALIASVLLTLILMFAESLGTVQKSKAESVSIFVAEHIRARLLTDPDWPPGCNDTAFSRELDDDGQPVDKWVYDNLYFDDEGTELGEGNGLRAYQGILTFSRSLNYDSPRLDFIVLEVKPLPVGDSITYSFQRANRTPRPTE